eukprot:CAMPEP_0206531886 /NCGR_PEP_ID=MMETSP0325_2-20121206/4026_1 /ASSEMBLY_ACC=CAM_ASM_000347 /TAXON_ID=2866 /ORGANISM="Crypthecodinium cohnii, Strain Seligo" /LENGTH=518 /DNA_ID=CAMNT_0054028203 /DNA_START=333 /DNA_END=1888 /DNA_ORIENTATION=-
MVCCQVQQEFPTAQNFASPLPVDALLCAAHHRRQLIVAARGRPRQFRWIVLFRFGWGAVESCSNRPGDTNNGGNLFVGFHILAYLECQKLSKSAQIDSVRRIVADDRNLALIAVGIVTVFNFPWSLSISASFVGAEEHIPPGFNVVATLGLLLYTWGGIVLLVGHARILRQRTEGGKGLVSAFVDSFEVEDEEDTLPLENRGVSLSMLVSFVKDREIDIAMTTERVMQRYIKPESKPRRCPYVDLVKTLVDSSGVRAVKKPQYFVSHCWSDAFCILLEQLVIFSNREHTVLGPLHFWVDVFAINQHDVGAATELPMMPRVIQCSQAVLFTLNPWSEPKTLHRVWCLWELLQAVKQDVMVRPTMPEREELNFLDTIAKDRTKINQVLEQVDVRQANATVLADREFIFSEIANSIGFDAMNSMVKTNLQRCLQGVAVDRCFGFAPSGDALRSAFRPAASDQASSSIFSSLESVVFRRSTLRSDIGSLKSLDSAASSSALPKFFLEEDEEEEEEEALDLEW